MNLVPEEGDDGSDVEEKLLHPLSQTHTRSSRPWAIFRIVEHIVLLLLAVLLIINLQRSYGEKGSGLLTPKRIWSGELTRKDYRYGTDSRYETLDHEFDYLWKHTMAPRYAEVAFPPLNKTGYSLDQVHDEGAIGMFHALHCLAGIRHALQRASAGEYIGVDSRDDPHWPHCFNYLRQAVLCMADDTYEMKRDEHGEFEPTQFIEGSYDVRTCRDNRPLFAMYEKYNTLDRS